MPWQTPKTDWLAEDAVTAPDMNRIEGNILFLKSEHRLAGPEYSRPAPGVAGRIYIATNAGRIWYDDGTQWILAAGEPKGIIKMWSGSIDSIPPGYCLCDGRTTTAADGTQVTVPDLRDRFIVGAGGAYAVGNTGGAVQVTLGLVHIPPHTHGVSLATAGSHYHTGTTGTAGSHNHPELITDFAGGNATALMWGDARSPRWDTRYQQAAGSHSHSFTTSTDGAHTHAVSESSVGGGQPHENRPPYFSLALIFKL